ncbi:MAG: hypothetical protein UZ21_OP11001000586 [Microgenomates bacterium OLB22]|nr:MAG: hypothetical protein UZ21_OP11001000586 [Microgenomates bacterium OLB22]
MIYTKEMDLSPENTSLPEVQRALQGMALTRAEIDEVTADPEHDVATFLSLFEADFKSLLDADAGVWEEYTLRRHTAMVLGQYHKYFRGKPLPHLDHPFFETVLALHDIGKPLAIAAGDKRMQHEYTVPMMGIILAQLDFPQNQIDIALAVVHGDTIGHYLKDGEPDMKKYVTELEERATHAGLSVEDFLTLTAIFFQIDAGSYTEDAGGLKSLDALFSFHPDEGRMTFSPRIEEKMQKLRDAIATVTH